MTKNQKVLELYIKYAGFSKYNAKNIANKEGVERRSISYLKTIESLCSPKEFAIVKEAITHNMFVVTQNGERTKSLECLVKVLKAGDRVVEKENNTGMVVYLLACDGKTKIGIAKSITNRLKMLQTGNPYPIVLINEYFQNTEAMARKKEKYLHDKYSSKRVNGEWFNLTNKELESVERYLKGENAK